MSKEELAEIDAAISEARFPSSLGFLKATNGIRPGEFSVIVGQRGNGKSALCKTIATECATKLIKCYVVLSEEKSSVYKSTISTAIEKMCNGSGTHTRFLETLYFDSILDWSPGEKTMDFFFSHLEEQINELQPEIVLFDNFTTSFLGGLHVSAQGTAIDHFRTLASAYNIGMVGAFHTTKGTDIYSKLIDGEDVRGNSSSTNAGAYNYILTTFFRGDKPRAFVFIDKARYHSLANKTYWELFYDTEFGLYLKDQKIDYNTIMGVLDEINKKAKEKRKGIDTKVATPKWSGY